MPIGLPSLAAALSHTRAVTRIGRTTEVDQTLVNVSGLSDIASVGDLVAIRTKRGDRRGEVLKLDDSEVKVLVEGGGIGLSVGDAVTHEGPLSIAPDDSWVGRVIDPFGVALDGRPLMGGAVSRSTRGAPPPSVSRKSLGPRLQSGLAVFDTMLPVVRGQRVGLFAGSGVGKSTLLATFARNLSADVVVIALVGERGREVRHFVETVLGEEGMKRSVVVAATSDTSAIARRQCALTAMAVAEHFRDRGLHAVYLADSVTRLAEAHREVALSLGESDSLRGFPPSVVPLLTNLCERAGPGGMDQGDITAIFSVLVAASDMDEPVADILRGVLDGHVVLNRKIAERGRFPAVDVLASVSRSLPEAATAAENAMIQDARSVLSTYEAARPMIQAGLYETGSDPLIDRAKGVWPHLDHFFTQAGGAESFERLTLALSGATHQDDNSASAAEAGE